jgi:hypothetical protein
VDALGRAQVEGRRLQGAIDAEYRSARRESTWGRTQPQIVERWRLAVRAWLAATETALAANQAALARFRAAPPAASPQPGESADWIEIRDALAGKMTVLGLLVEESPGDGGGSAPSPPPRSVWRKP